MMQKIIEKIKQVTANFHYSSARNLLVFIFSLLLVYDVAKLGKAGYINYLGGVVKSILFSVIKAGGKTGSDGLLILAVLVLGFAIYRRK